MNLLDDLDLAPEDLLAPADVAHEAAQVARPTPHADLVEPDRSEWIGPAHLHPTPLFVGDWLARALDAGLPYDLLVANTLRFAVHLAPASDGAVPPTSQGQVRRSDPADISDDGADRPLHTSIALMRAADETEREHLTRLGHQVKVFDLPDAQPFFGRPHHQSVFDACPLEAADLTALADSPLTVDRLVLTTRFTTSTDVLDRLSRDPAPGVRLGVASHPHIGATTAARLLGDENGDVYAAVVTNPAVDLAVKEAAVAGRNLSPVVEATVLEIARNSPGSARRRKAVARP